MHTMNKPNGGCPALHKPAQIDRATGLLWLSQFASALMAVTKWRHTAPGGESTFDAVIALIFAFAVNIFLIWKIDQGKNWGRIAFLFLFAIGLVPYFCSLQAEVHSSLALTLAGIFRNLVVLYALFLVFSSPGRGWFVRQPDSTT